jgi:hypothetical protein
MFTTLYQTSLNQASGFRGHVPPIRIFLANDIFFFLNFKNTGTLEHWNKLLKSLNKMQITAQNIQNISVSTLLEHTLFKKCCISTFISVLRDPI